MSSGNRFAPKNANKKYSCTTSNNPTSGQAELHCVEVPETKVVSSSAKFVPLTSRLPTPKFTTNNFANNTTRFEVESGHHKQPILPKVDVNVPLYVDYDQFGFPTIIGTPFPGPLHGVGSYWYQLGYLEGAEEAKARYIMVVYTFLLNAGRLAEFLGTSQVSTDTQLRRRTYTNDQWQQQINAQILDNTIPLDILDYADGRNQAYLDHITKIEAGTEPLPAEFLGTIGSVAGTGTFRWWWADRHDSVHGAATLFNRVNFIRTILTFSYGNSIDSTAVSQVTNLNSLISGVSTAGGGSAIQQVFDDVYGYPGVNSRFTVSEGDRCGQYCPQSIPCSSSNKVFNQRATKSAQSNRHQTRSNQSNDPNVRQTLADILAHLQEHPISEDEQPHGSNYLIVGPKLTKNKSTMMFGNSQLLYGFQPTNVPILSFISHITPRATCIGTGMGPAAISSGSDYTINYSFQNPANTMGDGIWEDASSLILLWDGVNAENVLGGQYHSTIKVRNTTTGAFSSDTVITIYQGNARKGLETNNRAGTSVFMSRKPIVWMKEAGYFYRWFASMIGILPFSNLDEFKATQSVGLIFMIGGLDTDGNIFTLESGFSIAPTSLINRLLPGDATAAGTFNLLAGRNLPYDSDANYIRVDGRMAKNPECGYIAGWNNIWANDEQTKAGRAFAVQRAFSIVQELERTIQAKGRLSFDDVRSMWGKLTYRIDGQNVVSSALNYQANPFPLFATELLSALQNQGLSVGLTQAEIDATVALLQNWDGRSIPAVDQSDILAGLNYDGRHVLSSIWLSFISKNLFDAAFPAGPLRTAAQSVALLVSTNLTPTANWSTSSTTTSRVKPVGVGSSGTPGNTIMNIFELGCNLGNTKQYPWLTNAGLTTPAAIQTFFAQALKDALTNQVTGSNAGTGLNSGPGGRADLTLIQPNGIPLHEGWGKSQRPTTTLGQISLNATQFLNTGIQVIPPTPVLNNQGDRKYVERDCKGNLIHLQKLSLMGWSSLLTTTVVNGVNVVTLQPHATDMNWYYRGNFATTELSMDIKY